MKTSRNRVVASRVAAVLFALILPLCTVASWGVTTVVNSNRWVATLHPLASNPTVTRYIADRGAATVVAQFHVQQRIEKLLPPTASFLAGTLTSELQKTLSGAITHSLRSETFQVLWDRENRLTHDVAVALLEGRANSSLDRARSVVLNLTPIIFEAIRQFDRHGNHFFDPLKTSLQHDRRFVLRLLGSSELQRAQGYFRFAITLRWLLVLTTLLLAVASVVTSRPIHRGLRRLALGLIVSAALTYSVLRVGIHLATNYAPTPEGVTQSILLALTSFLRRELMVLIVVGIGGLILSWFMAHPLEVRRSAAAGATWARHFVGPTSPVLRSESATRTVTARQAQRILLAIEFVSMLGALSLLAWWVHSISSLVFVVLFGLAGWSLSRHAQRRMRHSTPESANRTGTTPQPHDQPTQ